MKISILRITIFGLMDEHFSLAGMNFVKKSKEYSD